MINWSGARVYRSPHPQLWLKQGPLDGGLMLNAISRMTSPDKVREAILTSMISMNVMRRGAAVPIIYSSQLAFGKSEKRSIPNHYHTLHKLQGWRTRTRTPKIRQKSWSALYRLPGLENYIATCWPKTFFTKRPATYYYNLQYHFCMLLVITKYSVPGIACNTKQVGLGWWKYKLFVEYACV